jgi:hypothetical protein
VPHSKPNQYWGAKSREAAVAICLLGASICFAADRGAPKVLAASEAAKQLTGSNALACGSLSFYKGSLYVSAAAGLLEIENGSITKLYRWGGDYSVLEGLWVDNAHGLLWVYWTEDKSNLAYYDGRIWREVKFPKPAHGYVSRDDLLHGFRGVSNSKAFWLEGAGRAWKWQGPKSGKWIEESLPAAFHPEGPTDILVKRLIPTEGNVFFIKRGNEDWDWLVGLLDHPRMQNHPKRPQVEAKLQGDSAWYLANGHWVAVTNKDGELFAEEAAALREKGYLRTAKGDLFEVTGTAVSKLKTPGACEAIAPSADGTLLASFHGLGVFGLKEDWHKLLESPYADSERDFEVRLAAQRGCIALTVSPQPRFPPGGAKPLPSSPSTWVYNSRPGIWIAHGQEWKPVAIPPAQ